MRFPFCLATTVTGIGKSSGGSYRLPELTNFRATKHNLIGKNYLFF